MEHNLAHVKKVRSRLDAPGHSQTLAWSSMVRPHPVGLAAPLIANGLLLTGSFSVDTTQVTS